MTIYQSDDHLHTTPTAESRRRIICRSAGQFRTDVAPENISEIIGNTDDFLWLDLADPNEQDIALLRDEFGFHPLSIEDTAILAVAAAGVSSGCGSGSGSGNGSQDIQPAAVRVAPSGQAQTQVQTPVLDNAEADQSFATPEGVVLTERAPSPEAAQAAVKRTATQGTAETEANFISPGAPSDEQIAADLRELDGIQKRQRQSDRNGHGVTLERDGTATVAPGVPDVVARVVAGANAIATFPYVYGGGHVSFVDTAYDCSGSLSYALAAGGLLDATKTSGELAKGGDEGPGQWITIYANGGHTFMVVDGLRFDTSGRGGPRGTRWQTAPRSTKGFEVRHPAGL